MAGRSDVQPREQTNAGIILKDARRGDADGLKEVQDFISLYGDVGKLGRVSDFLGADQTCHIVKDRTGKSSVFW